MTTRFPHLPRESWERYLAGELADAAAARVEAHLEACPSCLAAAEEADPSLLFRRLRALVVREEAWDGFLEGIEAEIGRGDAGDSDAKAGRSRRNAGEVLKQHGWAATLALCAGLAILLGVADRGGDVRVDDAPSRASAPREAGDDEACPPELAHLRLSRKECETLRAPIGGDGVPAVIFSSELDLRDL